MSVPNCACFQSSSAQQAPSASRARSFRNTGPKLVRGAGAAGGTARTPGPAPPGPPGQGHPRTLTPDPTPTAAPAPPPAGRLPGPGPSLCGRPGPALVLEAPLQLLSSDAPSRRRTGEAGGTKPALQGRILCSPSQPRSPRGRWGKPPARSAPVPRHPEREDPGNGDSVPAPPAQRSGAGGTARDTPPPCSSSPLPAGTASPARTSPSPSPANGRVRPTAERRFPHCRAGAGSVPQGESPLSAMPASCSPLEVAHQPAPRRGGHDRRGERVRGRSAASLHRRLHKQPAMASPSAGGGPRRWAGRRRGLRGGG